MTPTDHHQHIDHPKAVLFYEAIIDSFEKNKIDYAILRNYQHLPDVIAGDLDFLIAPEQMPSVKTIITSLEQQLNTHPFFTSENKPHYQKFYFLEGKENVIFQLDFHSYLGKAGFQYVAARTFLNRRQDFETFSVLDEQDRMAMYLFHCLFDKHEFRETYVTDLQALLCAHRDVDFLKDLLPNRLYGRVMSSMRQNRFQDLFRFRRPIRLALIRRYPQNLIQPFIVRFAWLIKRLPSFFKPIGTHAAFIGPDGSGKTSIIDAVFLDLKKYALPSVKKVNMGFRKRGILPLDRINTAFPKHSIFKNIWLFLGLIDFYLQYVLKVYPALVRGGIVLSDRYMYDIFTGRFQIVRHKFLKRIVLLFTPDPDICFIVKRDPLAIKACRVDQDIAAICRYYETVKALKKGFFHEIKNDDGNVSKKTCMAQIIDHFRQKIS